MAEKKKMYVVFCEDNEKYWCSYNTWSNQLRKATIFHSTKYANDVHKRFKELRLKNVEVRMEVVPEKPTIADRIRSMSDEELAVCLYEVGYDEGWDKPEYALKWLLQPAEEDW